MTMRNGYKIGNRYRITSSAIIRKMRTEDCEDKAILFLDEIRKTNYSSKVVKLKNKVACDLDFD